MDSKFLEQDLWGLPLANYLWFAGIVLITFLLRKPAARFIASASCKIANRYADEQHGPIFRDLVRKPMQMFLEAVFYFIAVSQLSVLLDRITIFYRKRDGKETIDLRLGSVIDHFFLMVMIITGTLVLSRIVDFIYRVNSDRARQANNLSRQQLIPLVKDVVKLLLWVTSLFWILGAVFQVNIPALIAGLGIGGIAIALAAKESVENLFAAFTILSDKPFKVNDAIKLGTFEGKVERIGFRATRLRSGNGASYIIPNKKLVNENLENLSERDTSGVKMVINIKYGIAEADLQKMIGELKVMIKDTLHVTGPMDVTIEGFGENVFQLQLSYHLPHPMTADISAEQIKQNINLKAYGIVARYTSPEHADIKSKEVDMKEVEMKNDEEDTVSE